MKRKPRKPRDLVPVLEVAQVAAVLRAAQRLGPFEHALAATGYHYELRAGEYGRIKRAGVDLARGVRVRGRTRVFLPGLLDLPSILRAWLAVHPGGPWLFPAYSDTSKGIHRSRVYETFRRIFAAAGLPSRARYPDVLRRSLAAHLSKNPQATTAATAQIGVALREA